MWPDDSGDWGNLPTVEGWMDPTGTTAQNGPQVQANDVLTQSTVSNGPDKWSGLLQGITGSAAKYLLQRDAAKHGLVQGVSPTGQPAYQAAAAAPAAPGLSYQAILMIGGAIAIAMLLATKKG